MKHTIRSDRKRARKIIAEVKKNLLLATSRLGASTTAKLLEPMKRSPLEIVALFLIDTDDRIHRDDTGHPIATFSIGGRDKASLNPTKFFKANRRHPKGVGMIVAHNHPTRAVAQWDWSWPDMEYMMVLRDAAELYKIDFTDGLLITPLGWLAASVEMREKWKKR
jgi:DNA repair protein RadC